MKLTVRDINSDYFRSNGLEDHPCNICLETPKDDPERRWVAHENPFSKLYSILTRSLFSQYVHPMHDDCYAQLKESSNNCPECRAVICKEGEVLEDVRLVFEDDFDPADFIDDEAAPIPLPERRNEMASYLALGASLLVSSFCTWGMIGTSFLSRAIRWKETLVLSSLSSLSTKLTMNLSSTNFKARHLEIIAGTINGLVGSYLVLSSSSKIDPLKIALVSELALNLLSLYGAYRSYNNLTGT